MVIKKSRVEYILHNIIDHIFSLIIHSRFLSTADYLKCRLLSKSIKRKIYTFADVPLSHCAIPKARIMVKIFKKIKIFLDDSMCSKISSIPSNDLIQILNAKELDNSGNLYQFKFNYRGYPDLPAFPLFNLNGLELFCPARHFLFKNIKLNAGLRKLSLCGISISDQALSQVTGLTSLYIYTWDESITDASIIHLTELTELIFRFNFRITDASILKFQNLTRLSITPCKISPECIMVLPKLKHLILNYGAHETKINMFTNITNLEILDWNKFEVSTSFSLTNLKVLLLSDTNLSDHSVDNLRSLTSFISLNNMDITWMSFSKMGSLARLHMKALLNIMPDEKSSLINLTSLTELEINNCVFPADSFQYLTGLTHLSLESVDINNNSIKNLMNLRFCSIRG